MRKRQLLGLLTGFCLFWPNFALRGEASTAASEINTVQTGTFHIDELPKNCSGPWLALYGAGQEFELVKVNVKVNKVFDPIVDKDETKPTGQQVVIEPKRATKPIALVRDRLNKKFHEGRVLVARKSEGPSTLNPGPTVTMTFNSKIFKLSTQAKLSTLVAEKHYSSYRITLSADGHRQTLFRPKENVPEGWLVWAGDLDGDGKLDLIMSLATHSIVSNLTLFLSSAAGPQDLLKAVATHDSSSC